MFGFSLDVWVPHGTRSVPVLYGIDYDEGSRAGPRVAYMALWGFCGLFDKKISVQSCQARSVMWPRDMMT